MLCAKNGRLNSDARAVNGLFIVAFDEGKEIVQQAEVGVGPHFHWNRARGKRLTVAEIYFRMSRGLYFM